MSSMSMSPVRSLRRSVSACAASHRGRQLIEDAARGALGDHGVDAEGETSGGVAGWTSDPAAAAAASGEEILSAAGASGFPDTVGLHGSEARRLMLRLKPSEGGPTGEEVQQPTPVRGLDRCGERRRPWRVAADVGARWPGVEFASGGGVFGEVVELIAVGDRERGELRRRPDMPNASPAIEAAGCRTVLDAVLDAYRHQRIEAQVDQRNLERQVRGS